MFASVDARGFDAKTVHQKESIVQFAKADDRIGWTKRQILEHSARTAVTAVASLLVARSLGQPEPYWALVTTLKTDCSKVNSSRIESDK